MLHFRVFVPRQPRRSPGPDFGPCVSPQPLRPNFHEINAQFASRMGLRDLSSLECAVAEKYRVLPVFGRNRQYLSPLECAVLSIAATIDSKELTVELTPLECAVIKNKGGTPGQMFFSFFGPFPIFGPCEVRRSDVRSLRRRPLQA